MSRQRDDAAPRRASERDENLWRLAYPPGVWLAHLLATYLTGAIYCAGRAEMVSLGPVRVATGIYTLVALIALALLGRRAGHRLGRSVPSVFDEEMLAEDTRHDRRAFLGFATLLLCGLAIVAVIFSSLPAVFVESCR